MNALPDQCDYFSGMFQSDPIAGSELVTLLAEPGAAAHHEAAHAVTMYAFGKTIELLQIHASYVADGAGGLAVAYGGYTRPTCRPEKSVYRFDYPYRHLHFREGVISAVGPAGERRYRREFGIPMRILGGSEGDHRDIDQMAKALEGRGRSRYAYRRLVWRAAQRIIEIPSVWEAVEEIAAELLYVLEEVDFGEPSPGAEVVANVDPRVVHSVCRRHGVTRGAFRAPQPALPIFSTRAA